MASLVIRCWHCRAHNGDKSLSRARKRGICLNKECSKSLKNADGKMNWGVQYKIKVDGKPKTKREYSPKGKPPWGKEQAETRKHEIEAALANGEPTQKPETKTTFRDLSGWYLTLAVVKAKRSYVRDVRSVGKLNTFFGDSLLKDIQPAMVEDYIQGRLQELSYRGHNTKPATVHKELACMNYLFNQAIRNGKATRNPAKGVKRPKLNNERDRVLSDEEYGHLIAECPGYIEPVIKLAYYTGMREGEITKLTWDMVDLKSKGINLTPGVCKTDEGRFVPLHPVLVEMFKAMPHGLPGVPVFTRNGKPITESTIRVGWTAGKRRAGIEACNFHDLRHTFNTNAYLDGMPIPTIMKITGHKSLTMFKRYLTITPEDLRAAIGALHEPGVTQKATQEHIAGR